MISDTKDIEFELMARDGKARAIAIFKNHIYLGLCLCQQSYIAPTYYLLDICRHLDRLIERLLELCG